MKILGIDICKDRAVCWLLESVPTDVKAYWKLESKKRSKDPMKDEFTFYFTRAGMDGLFALKPDAIALEPTGMHYSYLVAHVARRYSVRVFWVGHTQATSFRRQNNLPDKNDLADAMAIACYSHLYYDKPSYFISYNPEPLARMRELFMQFKSLARFQNPFINRGRQQLAREFPEAMAAGSQRQSDGRRPLWVYLAGRKRDLKRRNYYWEKKYRDSLAVVHDIPISSFTVWLAQTIDDIDLQHLAVEKEMFELVYLPKFERYNAVFDRFGFHLSLRALLLSQIYPIERFERMSAFKKRIGAALDENASGSVDMLKKGGSKLCRTEFYVWVTSTIALKRKRPSTEVGRAIANKYDGWLMQFESGEHPQGDRLDSLIKAKALKTMRDVVSASLETYLADGEISERLKMMEIIFDCQTKANGSSKPPNRKQIQRRFGKLVIGKTTGYTARLLYRELKRATSSNEQ